MIKQKHINIKNQGLGPYIKLSSHHIGL